MPSHTHFPRETGGASSSALDAYPMSDRSGKGSTPKPELRRSRSGERPAGLEARTPSPAPETRALAHRTPLNDTATPAHEELPEAVTTLQARVVAAQQECDATKSHANPAVHEAALERRDQAMMAYLTEVTTHLRQLSKAPATNVTPSLKQYGGNVAGALTNNLLSFFIPTLATAYIPERHQAWAYALALGVLAAPAAEASAFVQRMAGGATAQVRLSLGDHANVGSYKAIAGDFMAAMSNLALYGIVSGGLSASPRVAEVAGGTIGRSLVAGVVMSTVGQAVITGIAKNTLTRNGVDDAKNLPESAHNRTIADGIYLQKDAEWTDRTTLRIKVQEVTSRVIGGIFGAAAYGGIREGAHEHIESKAWQNVATVMGGIGAYLLIAHVVRGLFTYFMGDPAKHANRFGIAASDIVSHQIRNSAVNQFDKLLDTVAVELHQQPGSEEATAPKARFDDAYGVLSGAALRGKGEHMERGLAVADRMQTSLRDVATTLQGNGRALSGTEIRLVRKLEAAAESIRLAKEHYESGAPIQPELQDIGNRLRDVQALVLEAAYRQNEATGLPQPNDHVMAMTETLMPAFAALRELDRRGNAQNFIRDVREFTLGNKSATDVVSELIPDGHSHVLARDVAAAMKVSPADTERLLNGIERMFAEAFKGDMPPLVRNKLMILQNQLQEGATPRQSVDAFLARLQGNDDGSPVDVQAIGREMRTAFSNGQFSPAEFLQEVARWRDQANATPPQAGTEGPRAAGDIEANPGAHQRRALSRLEEAMPAGFEATVKREFPIEGGKALREHAEDMVDSLRRDQAAMPEIQRGLMASALSLPNDGELAKLAFPPQNDAHFHPTSYSGRINSLNQLVGYMDRNNIEITNLAGIPSQVYNPTAERKYYANSEHGIDYRDHDFPLAVQFEKLTPAQKERFDLSITGFDVTNGPNIMQELKNRLRAHPGVFKAVGEVTLKKEIITSKNPHNPQIDGAATQALFDACANAGLPLILHCDRSEPGQKDLYADQVFHAIEQWVGRSQWQSSDTMVREGAEPPPKMVPKIVWAHGAGISRFTAESNTHTQQMDRLLTNPALNIDGKPVLSLDLSWDFIAHDILENVHDQLKNRGDLSPPIREGIQNLLRAYKSFTELGGRSDKADDLGRKTLSALDRVGGEEIADIYFKALENFKSIVNTEMKKPEVHTAFLEMATTHGTDGNNWLYIFRQHQDRLLFGTDALAVGIKAHGDAAYAMNTQVLTPMYHIFDALGEHGNDPLSATVSKKVATENYKGVFRDEKVAERRAAFEEMLKQEQAAEHSTNAQPQQFVSPPDGLRQRTVAGTEAIDA